MPRKQSWNAIGFDCHSRRSATFSESGQQPSSGTRRVTILKHQLMIDPGDEVIELTRPHDIRPKGQLRLGDIYQFTAIHR